MSLRFISLIGCGLLAIVMVANANAQPGGMYVSTNLQPTPGGVYVSHDPIPLPSGWMMMDLKFGDASQSFSPPTGIGGYRVDSFFDIFTELSMDFGGGTQLFDPGQATSTVRVTRIGGSGSGGTFQTEMLALNLMGGTLPSGVIIRESPTRASQGETIITDVGGGQFHVDSFFDVWTELSVDGGQTWLPATDPAHVTLDYPEPTAAGIFSVLGLLAAMRRRR